MKPKHLFLLFLALLAAFLVSQIILLGREERRYDSQLLAADKPDGVLQERDFKTASRDARKARHYIGKIC